MSQIISQPLLLLVILIEGFVTISAEILSIRQLIPVAGNSVIVTSLIIGVFLLFLAYGYRRGGAYQTDYLDVLKRNFTLSAIWLGVGLSYVFIYWFFSLFKNHIHAYILWALTAYLLLITAPLVYILGQTVPITMNLIRQAETTGATGGKILHLSTIGSFLGAVFTSLILMNYLGVAWTVVINCILLMLLTLFLFSSLKQDWFRILLLFCTLVIVYRFNVTVEKMSFIAANPYANYSVMKHENGQIFMSNESPSSFLNGQKQAFPYIEYIKRLLFQDLKLSNKDILVLGAGGFTLSAAGTNGNRFTYVDVDKDIKDVVQKSFQPKIKGDFIADDARNYLNTTNKKYDVIVSDVYSNARSIPAHLLNREYFMLVNHALNDGAIAIFNIIANPTLDDIYSETVDNTIRSVFKQCMVVPLPYSRGPSNIIYVCQKNLTMRKDLYTDDMSRATLDFFNSAVPN